jgi:hypothetical protein
MWYQTFKYNGVVYIIEVSELPTGGGRTKVTRKDGKRIRHLDKEHETLTSDHGARTTAEQAMSAAEEMIKRAVDAGGL